MPLYTYSCDEHGEFAAWARMSDSDAPQPCPACTWRRRGRWRARPSAARRGCRRQPRPRRPPTWAVIAAVRAACTERAARHADQPPAPELMARERLSDQARPGSAVKYRLAIFDFDGTLADSYPWFTRVIDVVADEFGFGGSAPRNGRRCGPATRGTSWPRLGVPLWKVPRIARRMRQLKALEADRPAAVPGRRRAAAALAQRGVAARDRQLGCREPTSG